MSKEKIYYEKFQVERERLIELAMRELESLDAEQSTSAWDAYSALGAAYGQFLAYIQGGTPRLLEQNAKDVIRAAALVLAVSEQWREKGNTVQA